MRNKNWLIPALIIAAILYTVLLTSCRGGGGNKSASLPLPPAVDSGVVNGRYYQTDYGFAIPVPSKWSQVRLSEDQEVDEVARFTDVNKAMVARISVQLAGVGQKFDPKAWADNIEQDLESRQIKVLKRSGGNSWKTDGNYSWRSYRFRTQDGRKREWVEEEWVLPKEDFLIAVHATLSGEQAETEAGRKAVKSLEESLTGIQWYTPIGPRGVSQERFELLHFTDGFCRAIESRSLARVAPYFSDMYPERSRFNGWYQQMVGSGDPTGLTVKAELSGMVIKGDSATASFSILRSEKNGPRPAKTEKAFSLSKKEGTWKIISPAGKNQ